MPCADMPSQVIFVQYFRPAFCVHDEMESSKDQLSAKDYPSYHVGHSWNDFGSFRNRFIAVTFIVVYMQYNYYHISMA